VHPLTILALALFAIFLVVLGGPSAIMAFVAYRKHKRYKLLGGTGLTVPGKLKPGLAKTAGKVVGMEQPLVSPMTRRECVFYEFRVEERRTRIFRQRRHGPPEADWVTIVHDRQSTRFALEDESGEAEIDLDGGEVTMKDVARNNTGMFQSVPPELERVLRNRYGTSTRGLIFDKVLRYTEVVIEEGDRLIALGEARAKKRGKGHVVGKGDKVPLLVSDKRDEEMANSYARSRNWWTVGAIVPAVLLVPVAIGCSIFLVVGLTAKSPEEERQARLEREQKREEERRQREEERKAREEQRKKELEERLNKDKGKQPKDPPDAEKDRPKDGKQPPKGDDFVGKALEEVRKGGNQRNGALIRLGRAPTDPEQRKQFDEARADPARRQEVAAQLVEVLQEGERTSKTWAGNALELWVTAEVVPDLVVLLDKSQGLEGRSFIRALEVSKDPRAIPALVRQLKNNNNRLTAGRALEAMGPAATKDLIAALSDETTDRQTACRVLEKVGTAEAIPALEELAKSDDKVLALSASSAVRAIRRREKQ